MKKSILTIVLAVFAITAFAQDQVRIPNGYQGFLEYGNTWHVFDKEMPNNINLSTTHGFYFSDHIYAGIGIAFDFNNDRVIVPVYANMRYVFVNNKTVSPVLPGQDCQYRVQTPCEQPRQKPWPRCQRTPPPHQRNT